MGKLDHMKITEGPACFSEWARKFNDKVDLTASMQGGPGVDIQVAHSASKLPPLAGAVRPNEQPRGKILVSLRPSAIQGLGAGGGATLSNAQVNSLAYDVATAWTVNVVGQDGKLLAIDIADYVSPNAYPTYLQVGNNNPLSVAISPTGIQINDASGGTIQAIGGSGFKTINNGASHTSELNIADGLVIANGGNVLQVGFTELTRSMGLKTFVGCNSGNAANYLVLASDFF